MRPKSSKRIIQTILILLKIRKDKKIEIRFVVFLSLPEITKGIMVVANYPGFEEEYRRYSPQIVLEQPVLEVVHNEVVHNEVVHNEEGGDEEYLEIVHLWEQYPGYPGHHCYGGAESEEDDEEEEDYPEGYDYPDEPPSYVLAIKFPGIFEETANSHDILPSTSFRDMVEDVLDLHTIDHDSKGYTVYCLEYPEFFDLDDQANYLTENITLICQRIYEPLLIHNPNNVVGNFAAVAA